MRILEEDLKHGRVRVLVEDLDDLWHLYNVIEPGDILYAYTFRADDSRIGRGKLRPERAEKQRVFLGIRVESIEFHKFLNRLRARGRIVHGPFGIGSYHTLDIGEGTELTIEKESWSRASIDRLREASERRRPRVLIVVLDEESADIAITRDYGYDILVTIRGSIPGKRDIDAMESERKKYLKEVAGKIRELVDQHGVQSIVIAGPGFYKDLLLEVIRESYPDLASICRIDSASHTGDAGIREVIKRGAVERALRESRTRKELLLVDELLGEIARGGRRVSYGLDDVERAARMGAVDKLLVLDKLLRDFEKRDRIEELMDVVRNLGGEVYVISSEHDGGRNLESLGGIAALLRFEVSDR